MTGVFRALPALVLGAVLLSGCSEAINIFMTVGDDVRDAPVNFDPWSEEITGDIPVGWDDLTIKESIHSDEDSNEDSDDTSNE